MGLPPDGLRYDPDLGFGTPITSRQFISLVFLRQPESTVAGHVLCGWNTLIAQLVKIASWSRVS